ncbi:uncharacterized protein LOC117131852 [Brassica rapa]|uniref:uncharacterized protein LOC117131852 n=1 Tax=Brassica campestris TaxID=3711 RepID=UPI00142D6FA2|nr:uncharacterized protein LOC117131852 [Brassica rapa]
MLKTRLKEAHDRHKSYADKRCKDLEFQVGDLVYLKMRTLGGSKTRKLKKLKPRYMGPYPIVERIRAVAYKLRLSAELSDFHDVFHVSVMRKVVREPELILQQPPNDLEKNLYASCQPVEILDRQVKAVQGMMSSLVKVRWERDGIQEETWEAETQMRIDYPQFFQDNIGQSVQEPNSGTNSPLVGENCNDPIQQAQQGPISLQETLGEFLFKQSQSIILFKKGLRRRTPADLEPSERDIGELSQPPSTEIRSITLPPSHSLGHQCVRDVETSPEQEFQPEIRRDAPTRAGGRIACEFHAPPFCRTFAGATAAGHRPFATGSRRRIAAASPPLPLIFR